MEGYKYSKTLQSLSVVKDFRTEDEDIHRYLWDACVASKSLVEKRYIKRRKHPAYGQMGLFATEPIKTHVVLGDYTGDVMTGQEYDDAVEQGLIRPYRAYTFEHAVYGKEVEIIINADHSNLFQYMNDYRGIHKAPNVQMFNVVHPDTKEIRIIARTTRWIAGGQELVCDYGEDVDEIVQAQDKVVDDEELERLIHSIARRTTTIQKKVSDLLNLDLDEAEKQYVASKLGL